MKKQFLILSFLLFAIACKNVKETELPLDKDEIKFCTIVDDPETYKSKVIQTKAIILGYHTYIFYNSQCLEQSKVLALGMSYESRQKISEVLNANKINYKTSFLNNNFYAEITVLGELKENDEMETDVFHPKYKFFVTEIKSVNILLEEIFPNDETRDLTKIKEKWNK